MQRGFDEFYGTIIGAGSFYDPNTLTRGNENVEHEAHARRLLLHRRDQRPGGRVHRAASRRSDADQPFFEYVAYTAPHWPLHAHDEDIAKYEGRFDAGWDALREERLEQAGRARASSNEHWKLTERDPTQPPWTEAEQTSSSAPGRCAAWRSTRRRSTAWTRASAASSPRSRRPASSTTRWSSSSPTTAPAPRTFREDVTIDELVDKLMIARSHTRSGEPVHFGNDADAHARAGEHLPELRHGLGEPVEHAVPPLQALDPRGRHRDAADRALAERHRRARAAIAPRAGLPARHHGDDPRRRPARPIPRSSRATPIEPLEGHVARCRCSRRRRRRAHADVLGARGQRRGAHRQVEARARLPAARGSSTTWTPTAPSCTTSPRSSPSASPTMAAQYDAWAKRCGVLAAREDRRADEEPGRDAGVLGEG